MLVSYKTCLEFRTALLELEMGAVKHWFHERGSTMYQSNDVDAAARAEHSCFGHGKFLMLPRIATDLGIVRL